MEFKLCRVCEQSKCASEYKCYKVCSTTGKEYFRSTCSQCITDARLKRVAAREIPVTYEGYLTCYTCKENKHSEAFCKNKASPTGLNYICRICAEERHKKAKRDPVKTKASQQKHHDANRLARNERNRLRNATPEGRAKNKARQQAYAKKNRSKVNAWDAERRAKKLNATPSWANLKKIKEFYISSDALGMLTGEWYAVDHIVPLQSEFVCGLHCEANLQILTRKENLSKKNYWWPDMWEPLKNESNL